MRPLCGDNLPHVVTGIPLELAKEQDPIWVAGSTMFSARLFHDVVSGTTYINMVTCSITLVGLGYTPSVVYHSMPTLLGEEEMDSNLMLSLPSGNCLPVLVTVHFSSVVVCLHLALC